MSEVVLLKSAGMSNTELAVKYSKTPEHISNVLNTPQAMLLRKQALDRLQEDRMGNTSERLNAIANKSIERVHDVIMNDVLFKESPFGVVDRAISLLKGVGKLENEAKKGDIHNKIQNAVILSGDHSKELLEGLVREREAEQLHSGDLDGDVIHQ